MRRAGAITRALVRACHPEPTLAVTAVATALAATAGRPWTELPAVAAAILVGQLSIGWLNDAIDAPRDAAVGRDDKPVAAGVVSRRTVFAAFAVAAVAAVPLTLLSGRQATVAHVVLLLSAWTYNLGAKATALSVVPYAVSFGLLPAVVVLGLPGAPLPPWWLVATGSLLGCAAHFANVLPDLDDDRATGVRGLPHRLGRTGSVVASAVLLLAATAVLAPRVPPPAAIAALVVAVGVLAAGFARARRPGSRAAFHAVLVVALVDVVLLLSSGAAVT